MNILLNHFQVLREYPFHIKVLYRFELGCIRLRRVCLKTAIFFAACFKKRQKKEQNRILKVYFKQMIKGFFFPRYISSVSLMVKERQRQLIESYYGSA